jgi:hypothetical protein
VALTGDDPVVLAPDTLAELEATLETQRTLRAQRRRERDLERERTTSVFETFPVGKLRPVEGPATDILRNAEPGCEVIGWPTTGRRRAVDSLEQILDPETTADSDALPTTEDRTPPYLVVQTQDGEPPAPETVDELLDVGYTPLDGERGPDRGGGGWPVEAEPDYQDHPLVGAYGLRLVETADDDA